MPPKKKQTKRKPEAVENESANKEVKQEEEAKDHRYFEPRFLSDFEVVYKGRTFHLHKVIMTQKSNFFRKIFENDKSCFRFEAIPFTESVYGDAITASDLGLFFNLLYRESPLTPKDYECGSDCPKDIHDCNFGKMDVLRLARFFNHFEMESYEKLLARLFTDSTVGNTATLTFLAICCQYNWKDKKDELIDAVAQVEEFWLKEQWGLIPSDVKELVYKRKITQCD